MSKPTWCDRTPDPIQVGDYLTFRNCAWFKTREGETYNAVAVTANDADGWVELTGASGTLNRIANSFLQYREMADRLGCPEDESQIAWLEGEIVRLRVRVAELERQDRLGAWFTETGPTAIAADRIEPGDMIRVQNGQAHHYYCTACQANADLQCHCREELLAAVQRFTRGKLIVQVGDPDMSAEEKAGTEQAIQEAWGLSMKDGGQDESPPSHHPAVPDPVQPPQPAIKFREFL